MVFLHIFNLNEIGVKFSFKTLRHKMPTRYCSKSECTQVGVFAKYYPSASNHNDTQASQRRIREADTLLRAWQQEKINVSVL